MPKEEIVIKCDHLITAIIVIFILVLFTALQFTA